MIIMEIRKFGRKRLAMSRINYEVPSLNYWVAMENELESN
jgi:hypothetical protein